MLSISVSLAALPLAATALIFAWDTDADHVLAASLKYRKFYDAG